LHDEIKKFNLIYHNTKEKIAKETEKMTFREFREYLNKNKLKAAK